MEGHTCRLVCEPDRGIYDAMNKGIALATGDIVGFLNADDFYAGSDVLSTIATVFADQFLDSCYGDLCYVSQKNAIKTVRYWRSEDFRPGAFSRSWCPRIQHFMFDVLSTTGTGVRPVLQNRC